MSTFTFKMILIRPPGTGKIIDGIVINKFSLDYKQTVGVNLLTKNVEVREGEIASLHIWDIGFTHSFEYLRKSFYEGTNGALIFFDLTSGETFEKAKKIYAKMKEIIGSVPFILIGDNIDLVKSLDSTALRKEAHKFANDEGGIYIETSQDNADILEEAMCELTRRFQQKQERMLRKCLRS